MLVLLLDTFLAGLSFVIALMLRYSDDFFDYLDLASQGSLLISVLSFGVLYIYNIHRSLWRYVSIRDLVDIFKACSYIILLFGSIQFLYNRLEDLPRSVFLLNWLILIILISVPRFFYRLIKERDFNVHLDLIKNTKKQKIPIILYGLNNNAELFLRKLKKESRNDYEVVAIIDDQKKKHNSYIHGVRIYGGVKYLNKVIEKFEAKNKLPSKIIITEEVINSQLVDHLLEITDKYDISLARLPRISDVKIDLDGKIAIKPIKVEDLLGRKEKNLDQEKISNFIKNKKILITGAGGTIGSELVRQISSFGPKSVILVELSEYNLYKITKELDEKYQNLDFKPYIADVRKKDLIKDIFQKEKPEIVFHAAALKHVPIVEKNITEGVSTNAIGTKNIADISAEFLVKIMVFISTDKAVNPTNVMGATKRVAENYINSLAESKTNKSTKYTTVRFGNVLGSSGSVIPLFEDQLKKGGPLTITHPDMVRYFMTVKEAVSLVIQSSLMGSNNNKQKSSVYVLDMGEPVRILDLATKMIKMAGLKLEKDIRIIFTGLRPGEKLFEELFYLSENPSSTEHKSIMLASPEKIEYQTIKDLIDELNNHAQNFDIEQIKKSLHKIVPEYN